MTKFKNLLERGVDKIINKKHLLAALKSGRKLRLKHGIDPTGPKIHLGRAWQLWKLKEFQDLGHKIILVIGDFTAQIGDPSDKLSKRPFLEEKQIKENLKTYKKQIGKILDLSKTEFHFNSQWLANLTFKEICQLAEIFSVQQMLGRRNFKERFRKGNEISLREFMYPLMQGYDSVVLKADVEIGGTDQLFNLKAGRLIQRHYGQQPQDIITTKMLVGLDGRKMSTSWGNVVNISDSAQEMYGKIMSIRDELIPDYFLLCTQVSLDEIDQIKKELKRGVNPKDFKTKLAFEIVSLYHGKQKAEKAAKEFVKIFKEKKLPSKIKTIDLKQKNYKLTDLLFVLKIAPSKSQARRLATQGAVKINHKIIKKWDKEIPVKSGMIIQVGKRKFVKIK